MEKNYKNESMVDVAYDVIIENHRIMNFQELYSEVALKLGFSDEEKLDKISKFYTNLSLDGRFVTLGNNEWDLRTNQTYDKTHIDVNDVYTEMDEEARANVDTEELEAGEEEEYNLDEDKESDEYDSSKDEEDL